MANVMLRAQIHAADGAAGVWLRGGAAAAEPHAARAARARPGRAAAVGAAHRRARADRGARLLAMPVAECRQLVKRCMWEDTQLRTSSAPIQAHLCSWRRRRVGPALQRRSSSLGARCTLVFVLPHLHSVPLPSVQLNRLACMCGSASPQRVLAR